MNGAGNGDGADGDGTRSRSSGGATDVDRIRVDPAVRGDEDEDESVADERPPDRDPESGPAAAEYEPGPNAARNWTALLAALALVSFATAAAIAALNDSLEPAIGAAVLGITFGGVALAGRYVDDRIVGTLAAGWAEHRRYVWFSTALFALGTVIGIGLLLAGVNLLELVAELLEEGLFPELEDEEFELTATFFIANNSQAYVMAILGALSLGLLTAFVMVFNGIVVGNIGAAVGELLGVDYILVGLAPHGIFELPALFIAAGVGFRLLYRFGQRVLGSREAFLTKSYVARTLALVVFGWLLLVLAAFVEAYVTAALLEALFGARLEEAGGAPLP